MIAPVLRTIARPYLQHNHQERAHSRFSASGFERIAMCPGSVALSDGVEDVESEAALRGTRAHEVLEATLKEETKRQSPLYEPIMFEHANQVKEFVEAQMRPNSQLIVEEKVSLDFIHPEAFGTLDIAIVEYFGTLDVMDYKYGKKLVSPRENWQFLFYALALAYKYNWNFHTVRMWTLQPNVKGFDGYTFWAISITELLTWVPLFKAAIERVEKTPKVYNEGEWCYFCKGRFKCPKKKEKRLDEARNIFNEY